VVVVLAIGASVAVVLTREDDDEGATTAPVSSTTPPTSITAPVDRSTAVWPWPSSSVRYQDPVAAARGFAVDFVGFVDPVVGEFQAGDSRSGEVAVQRNANGPVTTVLVRQLGNDRTWWVLGSSTPNIVLEEPRALASVSSPVTLRGTSTAFEATVNVELRQDDAREPLATTIVMGGANGEMGPFARSLSFSTPRTTRGAIVLLTVSPEDGRVAEATIVRIRYGPS
jgi:hypothetical protein